MNPLGTQLFGRGNDMMEHRPTGNRMQYLGQGGLHSGPLAGGQNDNV
jgi:hypothetical protein